MEEILASIRRIISDDDAPQDNAEASAAVEEPDMSADLSQDDLDKLFDSDGGDFDVEEEIAEPEMEAEPEEDVATSTWLPRCPTKKRTTRALATMSLS